MANSQNKTRAELDSALEEMIATSDAGQLTVFATLMRRIMSSRDPDIASAILVMLDDPVIDSILGIAGKLDEEGRDQLLFFAEDLFREAQPPVQPTRKWG
ncbi:MAG: hypothetical protein AAF732_09665 [Pseudomonadota bacterium]